jgi:hypothetical protein
MAECSLLIFSPSGYPVPLLQLPQSLKPITIHDRQKSSKLIMSPGETWMRHSASSFFGMSISSAQQLLGVKKQKPFLHLSLSKAAPFTLESHIYIYIKV